MSFPHRAVFEAAGAALRAGEAGALAIVLETEGSTYVRAGAAAWFGGSLFGLAGLNAAAEESGDRRTADRVSSIGWAKWSPVNALAIGAHLIGGAGLLAENRKRAVAQKGHTGTVNAKLALTAAALAA